MRWINFILIGLLLTGCFKEDIPVPPYTSPEGIESNTAAVGQYYENQVFFDLESNTFVKTIDRTSWDLAFETQPNGHYIFLNGANLMRVIRTGTTDFEAVTSHANSDWFYDNSNGVVEELAIGNWANENSGVNYTSKKEVYIIDRGYTPLGEKRGEVKFQLLGLTDGNYTLKFGPLNNSIVYEVTLTKDDRYNFVHLCFDDGGKTVFAEPLKETWDLVFTQYTAKVTQITTGIVEDYSVNGVLLNRNRVEATTEFAKPFNEIVYSDLENYNFTNQRDIIGYEWKDFDFDSNTYSIFDNHTYLVKTQEGNYYKLRFTGFVNSEGKRGFPSFEFGKF